MFTDVASKNPLDFEGYEDKVSSTQIKAEVSEAVTVGTAEIQGRKIAVGVMDPGFMMGSMGSAVGERITCLVEHATKEGLPVIIVTASGGARMQEGIFSLMQMAKTSMALKRHSEAGLLYVSILTDPTTGGVTASLPCWVILFWRNLVLLSALQAQGLLSKPYVKNCQRVFKEVSFT